MSINNFIRDEEVVLTSWLNETNRKPLVIRGARQVGKSSLVRSMCESNDLRCVEINFERNPQLAHPFTTNDPHQIIQTLTLTTGQKIEAGASVLFLDEVQTAPHVLQALRYFFEELPDLAVVAAGSLLDFTLNDAAFPMPVGRIEYFHLGPVTFENYLKATGNAGLAEFLENLQVDDLTIEVPVHEKLLLLLRQYLLVGGMPEAVAMFAASGDYLDVRRIQNSIVDTYADDFNKYSNGTINELVRLTFERAPSMVGNKFKYSHVSDSHKSAAVSQALTQLCLARVMYRVTHSSANGIPLSVEAKRKHFKTLFLDVGLMARSLGLDVDGLDVADLNSVNAGSVMEQFIGQHLLYRRGQRENPSLHYWTRQAKSSNAEVDYVIDVGQKVVPVEVKTGTTGTLKSLHQFVGEKEGIDFAVRFNSDAPSIHGVRHKTASTEIAFTLLSLPHYAVGQADRLIT